MQLILASNSPRRRDLLKSAGYDFILDPPDESAEARAASSNLNARQLVAHLALEKAKLVAARTASGTILAADTVAECHDQILGKPKNRQHACEMLSQMSGQVHFVHTAICLWRKPGDQSMVRTDTTELIMDQLSKKQIQIYLDTQLWQGKAGAFGYQDDLDWVHIRHGSPSNVVGLPMELLAVMLDEFAQQV